MKHVKITLALLGLLFLASCNKETEQDIIADAQYCLDEARDATAANACAEKLGDIQTPQAYVIRCSANFISEGFGDPQTLMDALENLEEPSGGQSATEAFLSVMTFSSVSAANTAFDNCVASGQKGLSMLAAMTKAATNIASLGNIIGGFTSNPSPAQIEEAIQNIIDGNGAADAAETIGQTVVAVYDLSCSTAAEVNQDMCGPMKSALESLGDNPTAEQVGLQVLAHWNAQ